MSAREEFRNVDLFSLQCPPCLGHDIQVMFNAIDELREINDLMQADLNEQLAKVDAVEAALAKSEAENNELRAGALIDASLIRQLER